MIFRVVTVARPRRKDSTVNTKMPALERLSAAGGPHRPKKRQKVELHIIIGFSRLFSVRKKVRRRQPDVQNVRNGAPDGGRCTKFNRRARKDHSAASRNRSIEESNRGIRGLRGKEGGHWSDFRV